MKPEFHLARVFEDGTAEAPEIVPVAEMRWSTSMDRRGALAAGLGLSGVLAMLAGCVEKEEPPSQQVGPPTCKVPDIQLRAHDGAILALAASPDGKTLLSSSADRRVKGWLVPGGAPGSGGAYYSYDPVAIAFTPDDKRVAIGGADDGTITLRSLESPDSEKQLHGHAKPVRALAFTPDGKHLVSASKDGAVRVWSYPAGEMVAKLETQSGDRIPLAVSAETLVVGMRSWSTADWKPLPAIDGLNDTVRKLAFTPDGKVLVAASYDGMIGLWSMSERKSIGTLRGGAMGYASPLAVVANGNLLATGGQDGSLRFWSLPDAKLSATFRGHRVAVDHLAFLPNANLLASGDRDGSVCLWDLSMRENDCLHAVLSDQPEEPRSASSSTAFGGVGSVCTCNKVCTCIPVSSRRWKRKIEPLRGAPEARDVVHQITLLVDAIQSQQRRLAELRRRLRR